jgi:predicted PurR-regulated permease PerM
VIDRLAPVAIVLSLLIVAFLTVEPFLPAILWGVVLAIAIEPRHRRLVHRLGERPRLASAFTATLLIIAFVLPAAGLARALVSFVPDALNWFEGLAAGAPREPPATLRSLPAIGPQLAELWHAFAVDASEALARFREEIKTALLWVLTEAEIIGVFVLEFAIGILLAVVFVHNGERLAPVLQRFFHRVGGPFAQQVAEHSVVTVRQTVRGVLGATLVQTLVATVSYIAIGLPNWTILAAVTFLLGLTQIGPVLVFLPLTLWLWADGQTWAAAFVFVWGMLVVNTVDNLVRPFLTSKDGDIPASLAFIGALGGVAEWGVLGAFLGPVVLAVVYEIVLEWIEPGAAGGGPGDAATPAPPAPLDP